MCDFNDFDFDFGYNDYDFDNDFGHHDLGFNMPGLRFNRFDNFGFGGKTQTLSKVTRGPNHVSYESHSRTRY